MCTLVVIKGHPSVNCTLVAIKGHSSFKCTLVAIKGHHSVKCTLVVIERHPNVKCTLVVIKGHPSVKCTMMINPCTYIEFPPKIQKKIAAKLSISTSLKFQFLAGEKKKQFGEENLH